jgi:single-stranded-DNA-specific exonuclease
LCVTPTSKQWCLAEKLPEAHFGRFPDVPRIVVQLLHNRGICEPDHVHDFLAHTPQGATDPFQLKGMTEAVARLQAAIASGEPIAVFGDYDADGVTAAALLTQVLHALGANLRPQPYIPDRVEEGYGLNNEALAALAGEGMRVVVTVDCGIRSIEEAARAAEGGLDLIITDHHMPGDTLPPAVAVINPKQPGCEYPFRQLAGVGVAFKLAQALLTECPPTSLREDDLLDLVALGTVADLAPLVDENRTLVTRGLEQMNRAPRLGIKKLMETAGLAVGAVGSRSIGYSLAPRLNAAGRLESAYVAYDLLMASDETQAGELAQQLHLQNIRRQEDTRAAVDKARKVILADGAGSLLYLIAEPDFGEGIVGLVAGRLTDEFYRPTLVGHRGSDTTRGSARSIPELHITRALDECVDLLVRHGGHSAAAGFTVPNENLWALHRRLLDIAARELAGRSLEPVLNIDAELNLRAIDHAAVENVLTARAATGQRASDDAQAHAASGLQVTDGIERLRPYGSGNPQPLFASYGLEVRRKQLVGEGRHLKLVLNDGRQMWNAIGFHLAGWHKDLGERVDVAYRLDSKEWDGRRTLQLVIEDLRLA